MRLFRRPPSTVRLSPWRLLWLVLSLFLAVRLYGGGVPGRVFAVEELPSVAYQEPEEICAIDSKEIGESSGLAASRRWPNVFWTHNDSGDKPRLFAFDTRGKIVGTVNLNEAQNFDWEDMASFTLDGEPLLLVGDIGDNAKKRPYCTLYLCSEPQSPGDGKLPAVRPIYYSYEGGPTDCEALAVDPVRREILFVEKRLALSSRVYLLPIPAKGDDDIQLATKLGRISVPIVTAMDISPDGLRAVVMTLGNAYEFSRRPEETWAEAFARPRRTIVMPTRRQGEAICYGHDGKTLFLTSEKLPTPLFRVAPKP